MGVVDVVKEAVFYMMLSIDLATLPPFEPALRRARRGWLAHECRDPY